MPGRRGVVWFAGAVTTPPPSATPATTATATFCATLVDQWRAEGLTDAFIAPGSRSTPLALALTAPGSGVRCHLFHDERSASFAALGNALATRRATVVLCTSGTAATHFHGAVVEAEASDVPLLVCTADRPPELWGIGAPQTIDQTELYGRAVRWFAEPGPPDDPDADPASWRPLARRSWRVAMGLDAGTGPRRPGPVQLNLSFRDPLVGVPGPLPEPLGDDAAEAGDPNRPVVPSLEGRRGVIVAGRSTADPVMVWQLADLLGWPVIADHRSGCRRPGAIRWSDALLRNPGFAASVRPEIILRIGEPLASKALSVWIATCASDDQAPTEVVALTDRAKVIDPERVAGSILPIDEVLPALVSAVGARAEPMAPATASWRDRWEAADELADRAIGAALAEVGTVSEPAVARAVVDGLAVGGVLVVASSMPVRDVEWYGPPRDDVAVVANRGANGIDGVTSTAIGVALAGRATTLLIGDVAFLHDAGGLIGLAERGIDLTIVVVDNDGGGIFSFLPQHDLLDREQYEFLFGTPHGVDLTALARAHGIAVEPWSGTLPVGEGVRIVIAETDRETNVVVHSQLVAAVEEALGALDP